jgi:hypothetical protein
MEAHWHQQEKPPKVRCNGTYDVRFLLPLGCWPLGWCCPMEEGDTGSEVGSSDCWEAAGVVLSLCIESEGDAAGGGEVGGGRDEVWEAMMGDCRKCINTR